MPARNNNSSGETRVKEVKTMNSKELYEQFLEAAASECDIQATFKRTKSPNVVMGTVTSGMTWMNIKIIKRKEDMDFSRPIVHFPEEKVEGYDRSFKRGGFTKEYVGIALEAIKQQLLAWIADHPMVKAQETVDCEVEDLDLS